MADLLWRQQMKEKASEWIEMRVEKKIHTL